MGHCSNPQERMDKRCERWVFCEYGCHSIFWEISVYIYIYVQRIFVFYTYYDPTDPFLSLWKPTKKWKNISQRAHWWCHVQDFDGFDQFSGWVVFFVSTCSPPKDSNEWTFQLAQNDIEERSPCTCLLDIHSSHLAQNEFVTSPNHDCEFWLSWLMTLHVNIFLLSCIGSCLVCWILYNFKLILK